MNGVGYFKEYILLLAMTIFFILRFYFIFISPVKKNDNGMYLDRSEYRSAG